MSSPGEFVFVETASGGTDRRNSVMKLDEYQAPAYMADCFVSMLRFTEDLLNDSQIHTGHRGRPSVAGYRGPALAEFVPFDFDCKKDPAKAVAEAAQLVREWEARWDVPTAALRIYWSGMKGVSIEVPAVLFGGFEPATDIADKLKAIAEAMAPNAETLDTSIYELLRLWRVPNTEHSKSLMFKIPLMPQELFAEDMTVIETLARRPRHRDYLDAAEFDPVPALVELKESASTKVQDPGKTAPQIGEHIPEGSRNTTLTSMAGSMRRRGMTEDKIAAALLKVNQRCDPPLDEAEVRSIAKSISRYEPRDDALRSSRQPGQRPATGEVGILLSDVEPEQVDWIWPGRIPKGKLTVLDGDPGLGKSAATVDLAARVSAGLVLPDGTPCEAAGAVICSAEDGLADTIRPRLDAAGGDPSRVLSLATIPDAEGLERPISIPEDVSVIRQAIRRVDAHLVIVDPLMAFLSSKTDSYRDQDVRRTLAALSALAEETGVAIVIVRHLNKSGGKTPIYRGGGSIGIIGAARSGMMVGEDPDDENRRVLAPVKSNLAAPAPSLSFALEEAENGAVQVRWLGETDVAATDLLSAPRDEDSSALGEARNFLEDLLQDGPVPYAEVEAAAEQAGITMRTVKRAKKDLGVESHREGESGRQGGGRWVWSLSQGDDLDWTPWTG